MHRGLPASRRNRRLISGPAWLCRLTSLIPLPLSPDLADLLVPLERSFGCRFRWEQFPWGPTPAWQEFTAGELHEWVCAQLRVLGKEVPHSSWHRVQQVLCNVTGIAPSLIRPASRVRRDLRIHEGG